MEPKYSLTLSQVLATYPYPEPSRSSPYSTSQFLKIHLNIILHPSLCLPSGLFPSGFPTKTLYTPLLSPIRATWPTHLILLDLITRKIMGDEYRSWSSSLCSFRHSPVISSLLGPNILLRLITPFAMLEVGVHGVIIVFTLHEYLTYYFNLWI